MSAAETAVDVLGVKPEVAPEPILVPVPPKT